TLVWGLIRAGSAKNVIPAVGEVAGTLRLLDATAWSTAEAVVRRLVVQLMSPYGVETEVDYVRGVPPVVNEAAATLLMAEAAASVLEEGGVTGTTPSLGGEDFAWYLESAPGAMARLGTRAPGGPTYDLHQGNLHIDDRAVGVGARVLAATAVRSLRAQAAVTSA
ncbi:MAG: M20/M25/M40 family metallo-hydrolase, partial [Stackebrandtia sp.]